MELETVGRITVRDLRLEVCGKIDDIDGSKGTFLDACGKSPSQQLGSQVSSRFQDVPLGRFLLKRSRDPTYRYHILYTGARI